MFSLPISYSPLENFRIQKREFFVSKKQPETRIWSSFSLLSLGRAAFGYSSIGTSSVTMGKLHRYTYPQFPHLWNGDNTQRFSLRRCNELCLACFLPCSGHPIRAHVFFVLSPSLYNIYIFLFLLLEGTGLKKYISRLGRSSVEYGKDFPLILPLPHFLCSPLQPALAKCPGLRLYSTMPFAYFSQFCLSVASPNFLLFKNKLKDCYI